MNATPAMTPVYRAFAILGPLTAGPARDFVGYGPEPPAVQWPDGAPLVVNIVVNYEEGAEYSLLDDGVNDTWGEYSFQYGPEIRDLGTEMHFEYGSRVGLWRLMRLFRERGLPLTVFGCALALERHRPAAAAIRAAGIDVCCHG